MLPQYHIVAVFFSLHSFFRNNWKIKYSYWVYQLIFIIIFIVYKVKIKARKIELNRTFYLLVWLTVYTLPSNEEVILCCYTYRKSQIVEYSMPSHSIHEIAKEIILIEFEQPSYRWLLSQSHIWIYAV